MGGAVPRMRQTSLYVPRFSQNPRDNISFLKNRSSLIAQYNMNIDLMITIEMKLIIVSLCANVNLNDLYCDEYIMT